MTTKGIEEDFAQDLPKADRRILAARQSPTNGAAFGATVTNAAWKSKPTWYVVAANDRMIQPDLERQFAKTMGGKEDHRRVQPLPMLSHANEVARLTIDGAKGVPID